MVKDKDLSSKKDIKRKKPNFLRKDWHKKIKLGSTVKRNRKWRAAKGRHNKIRLGKKGQSQRPKIGWGANSKNKNKIEGLTVVRIENLKDLEKITKDEGIIISKVGLKKRKEIISKANEKKIKILNKYKVLPKDLSSEESKK
tara:strand:- start:4207 stop:4632 length:426 start_codon:yes stop_codon:yes gene_type:complete